MLRVVIAEDHSLVRDGLRLLLSIQPDMQLVADTDRGNEVLHLLQEHKPDVLLLDLGLPGNDGLEVMRAIRQAGYTTRVLIVTARLDTFSVRASLSLGAAGYLPKNEDSDTLLDAIRRIAAGVTYVSPEVAALFEMESDAPGALTERERQVLTLVGEGLPSKEIARRLAISDFTVRKHRENLCRKLGARNAAELVACAVRLGG